MSALSVLCLTTTLIAADSAALPRSAVETSLDKLIQFESARRDWHTNVDAGQAEAARLNLPVVLHFHASWCGACRSMEASVLSKPQSREHFGISVVGIKVDSDRYRSLISKYNVRSLPADIMLAPDGRIIEKKSGAQSLSSWMSALDRLSESGSKTESLPNDGVKLGPDTVAKSAEAKCQSCSITVRDGVMVGLGGFSPIALSKNREWKMGSADFTHTHEGVEYHMANAEELNEFESNPEAFTPRLHGCDPVVFSSQSRVLLGDIKLGVFHDDQLFFFATEASRKLFKSNPSKYADVDAMVELETSDIPVSAVQ